MATDDKTPDLDLDMRRESYFRDTPSGWIMQQILLDNMALGEGIPLRVIRLNKLKTLYRHFAQAAKTLSEEKFGVFFSDEESFNNFARQVGDWTEQNCREQNNDDLAERLELLNELYNELANSLFPALPSNLHSLEFFSQTIVSYWRIYALLWLYNQLVLDGGAPSVATEVSPIDAVYGLPNFSARCQLVSMKEVESADDLLLLAGPVFEVEVSVLANETGVDAEVTDRAASLLNKLSQLTSKQKNDGTEQSGSHFRQAMHLETVRQKGVLQDRFAKVLGIWPLLENATLGDQTKISHKYLRMLALWAQHINNLSKQQSEPAEIANIVVTSDSLYGEAERKTYLSANKNGATWCLTMQEMKNGSLREDVDSQRSRFYDLYTRLERITKQVDKNRLIVMNLWLESQFSALLRSSENAAPDGSDVVSRLAAWICAALRADIAEVHSYHPEQPKRPLKIHDMYIRVKDYRQYRDATINGLQDLLPDKQKISNIYQALLTGRERICLDRESASNSENKANEALCKIDVTLKDMYKGWPQESAEMVVPINFNGRVIGSTRVVSLGRWRFRWGQRILLLNIATNLGAYWYQQRHLSCLSSIQKHVLEFNQSAVQDVGDKVKLYHALCKQAAVLFLCRGAGLWLRNNIDQDEFNLEGWHGFEVMDKRQSIEKGGTFISYTVKGGNEDNPFFREKVESSVRICNKNKQKLIDAGITYVVHIPIRDKNKNVMAVLALYDSSTRGFDDSWRYIAQFFAGHLHVILDSVAAVIREREGRKQIIIHEISNSVSHLVEKARKIAKPIARQIDTLNQVHSALSMPAVVERLKIAKLMNEIPGNLDVIDELGQIIRALSSRWSLPLVDIKKYASTLDEQLYALSLGFSEGEIGQRVKKTYADNPDLISAVTQKMTNLLAKTADREFVVYLITNKLLGQNSNPTNLCALINQTVQGAGNTPYNVDNVNCAIDVNVAVNVLQTVLDNLWKNAEKYRLKPSDAVFFRTEETRYGCKLLIVNRTQTYRADELVQLTSKGYRRKSVQYDPRLGKSYNAGLGLYLVENLCKHVLHMTFEIRQENSRSDGSSDFVCELLFNPNMVSKKG